MSSRTAFIAGCWPAGTPEEAVRARWAEAVVRRPFCRAAVGEIAVAVVGDAAAAIIRHAMEHETEVIVMGTHDETGMFHRLFGDVAEEVVRSGVAPVLPVHSNTARRAAKE